jgi:large subunit ribosomal protein L21
VEAKKAAPAKKVEAKAVTPKKEAAPKAEPKKAAAKKATEKADDLKKIEGIGPKIASTLAEAGIATFADLAKATPAKISEIISGVRGNHVTDTWPKQAKLAADGKWDELKKWQDELDGGKA